MKPEQGIKGLLKRSIRKIFGATGYAKLLGWRYQYLPGRAMHHGVSFRSIDGLILAQDETSEFFFVVPERAGRYIHRFGVLHMTNQLWEKYVSQDITPAAGGTVIDVGANVGEFAVAAASRGLYVHAFEPDVKAWTALRRNLNGYSGCAAVQRGLGDRCHLKKFYVATQLADSSFIPPDSFDHIIELQIMTLDKYVSECKIERIDLLKIEAEGFEPEVLSGAEEALRITKAVTVDCSPERLGQDTIAECSSILSSSGFLLSRAGWIIRGTRPA